MSPLNTLLILVNKQYVFDNCDHITPVTILRNTKSLLSNKAANESDQLACDPKPIEKLAIIQHRPLASFCHPPQKEAHVFV